MPNNGVRLGIIGAMQMEIEGLLAAMEGEVLTEKVSGVTFYRGCLEGCEVVLAVCGVGKVAAAMVAEAMILRYGVQALLNTGVAGGLSDGLVVGDVVLARGVVQHDMDTTAIGDPAGLISGLNLVEIPTDGALLAALERAARGLALRHRVGLVATGDIFVADPAVKARIKRVFAADACEMEGGAIGQVAYTNGVPFGILRAISDGGDGMEFSEFAPLAAKCSVAMTRALLRELAQEACV